MFRRRRPLMRAAVVGGTAYYAGKKVQQGREQDAETEARLEDVEAQQAAAAPAAAAPAPAAGGGMTDDKIEQLKQLGELKDQGILTQAEFDEQKHKLLYGG
jgi:putative oligomerization/nucleic acid binding protein